MTRIYADYAATTPLHKAAHDAMLPWLTSEFGNPSSQHFEGRRARAAIDEARETLGKRLGCLFAEVLFTSSGTEAANFAVLGSAMAALPNPQRHRMLFGATEHPCVLSTQKALQKLGFIVELVPVDRNGAIDLDALRRQISDDVLLVSVMHANNELGTIQPVFQVAEIAHRFGALFHCDAVQTFTVWDWQITDIDADLVSLSAHKIGGPKGAGAIYVRAGVKPEALLVGGGQEREMRAGTENVAAIVGFAEAVRLAPYASSENRAAIAFRAGLHEAELTVKSEIPALPGHVHLRFPGIEAETLLIRLDRMGVSASAGAACSSGSLEPSHVLLACGYTEREAKEGVRFTFAPDQPAQEGAQAARLLGEAVREIRGA